MKIPRNGFVSAWPCLFFVPALGFAQRSNARHRVPHAASGQRTRGAPRIAFLLIASAATTPRAFPLLDMNGDGFSDLLSGAYWYENPGAQGGAWKQHQFRTVSIHNEFVSDCGEWIVDVDHDGLPDVITAAGSPMPMVVSQSWATSNSRRHNVEGREDFTTAIDTRRRFRRHTMPMAKPDIACSLQPLGVLWVTSAKGQASRPSTLCRRLLLVAQDCDTTIGHWRSSPPVITSG